MASLRSTSDPNSEKRSIANKASSCLQAFADLQKLQTQAEAGGSPCKDSRQDKNDGISLNAVKNELDRFRDWCSHNGATKEGPGSLDDGLQLAANTHQGVSDLLDNLEELLYEAKDILDRELSHLGELDDDDCARTHFKGLENESELSQIRYCIVSNVDNFQMLNKSIEWGIAKTRLTMPGP
ncbi:hypothetical protein RAB80_014202 [Fusarium oxysporum f. sp. vasinfectum]|nr:hypothetical protein RAB80_014202 [Fusarium oxysporum f. sp. vasinfectum]